MPIGWADEEEEKSPSIGWADEDTSSSPSIGWADEAPAAPTSAEAPDSFTGKLLQDVEAGWYSSAAHAAGIAENIFEAMDDAADEIGETLGLEETPDSMFERLQVAFDKRSDAWAAEAERLDRDTLAAKVVQTVAGLPIDLATAAAAAWAGGPIAGFAALGAIEKYDEGAGEMAIGALEGAALGKVLTATHGMGRLRRVGAASGATGAIGVADSLRHQVTEDVDGSKDISQMLADVPWQDIALSAGTMGLLSAWGGGEKGARARQAEAWKQEQAKIEQKIAESEAAPIAPEKPAVTAPLEEMNTLFRAPVEGEAQHRLGFDVDIDTLKRELGSFPEVQRILEAERPTLNESFYNELRAKGVSEQEARERATQSPLRPTDEMSPESRKNQTIDEAHFRADSKIINPATGEIHEIGKDIYVNMRPAREVLKERAELGAIPVSSNVVRNGKIADTRTDLIHGEADFYRSLEDSKSVFVRELEKDRKRWAEEYAALPEKERPSFQDFENKKLEEASIERINTIASLQGVDSSTRAQMLEAHRTSGPALLDALEANAASAHARMKEVEARIRSGQNDTETRADWLRHRDNYLAFRKSLLGFSGDVGRALNRHKRWTKERDQQRAWDEAIKNDEMSGFSIEEQIDLLQKYGDANKEFDHLQKIGRIHGKEKFAEYYKANLVSSPDTFAVNAVSNFFHFAGDLFIRKPVEIIIDPILRPFTNRVSERLRRTAERAQNEYDAAQRKLLANPIGKLEMLAKQGKLEEYARKNELPSEDSVGIYSRLRLEVENSKKRLEDAKERHKTYQEDEAPSVAEWKERVIGASYGVPQGFRWVRRYLESERLPEHQQKTGAEYPPAMTSRFGKTIRGTFRGLTSMDIVNKEVAYQSELGALAYRNAKRTQKEWMAKNKGVAPPEEMSIRKLMAEELKNPTEMMKEKARKYAEDMAFQNDLGKFSTWLKKTVSEAPVIGPMLVPFVATPVNVMKRGLEMNPLTAALVPEMRKALRGQLGRAAQREAIAKLAVGTGVLVWTANEALAGNITGGGPKDPRERQTWMKTHEPYAVRIGDRWVKLRYFGPWGITVGIIADTVDLAQRNGEDPDGSIGQLGMSLLGAIGKNLGNQTFVRGVADLADLFYDTDASLEKALANKAWGLVPFASGVRWLEQTVDPEIRNAKTVVERLRANTPGLSQDLPARRDHWGEPIMGTTGPISNRPLYPDKLDREIEELGLSFDPPQKTITVAGVKIELTPQEHDTLTKNTGQLAKKAIKQFVYSKGYDRLSDVQREKMIRKIYNKSREQARYMLRLSASRWKEARDQQMQ